MPAQPSVPFFTRQEFERRYAALRAMMAREKLDCLVLTGNDNWSKAENFALLYVTGLPMMLERSYVVFPKDGAPVMFTKKSDFVRMPMMPTSAPVEFVETDLKPGTRNSENYGAEVARVLQAMAGKKGRVGLVSEEFFPLATYRQMQAANPSMTFHDATRPFNLVRRIKSAEEIGFLKYSGAAADAAMAALIAKVEPGMSEFEMVNIVEGALTAMGCFPGALQLIGSGSDFPNYPYLMTGSPKPVGPKDLVLTELTSNYMGYCTQLGVPISFGEPNDAFKRFYEVNERLYTRQMGLFRPGRSSGEIDRLGSEVDDWTKGEMHSYFACQNVDFEQSFTHEDVPLANGIGYIVMPWINYTDRRKFTGHSYGNSWVCWNDSPIALHKTPMRLVVK
ncbi:MAG: hypothetical protein A3F84_13130 [Candidatus Handelsmanbacteria bacterium RIFCSPLOWO2_12_FULL_64_10]|uniref:Peptidase M24 domain-containing protein n=1 Tax=Handelsmanbacteria sp. (strain RIFCSPLOWO2_12_FULL_64_10) TaxID=1817868 RepID=A0A1F6D0F6_HANXR|nr:MAG: hypothetical protein A3F84_13130 [Candidatus Handelsmanbacteria bacterium RIFCSPLOWO2_12_FULL_64_10]